MPPASGVLGAGMRLGGLNICVAEVCKAREVRCGGTWSRDGSGGIKELGWVRNCSFPCIGQQRNGLLFVVGMVAPTHRPPPSPHRCHSGGKRVRVS